MNNINTNKIIAAISALPEHLVGISEPSAKQSSMAV
jgi:hypothetical protein